MLPDAAPANLAWSPALAAPTSGSCIGVRLSARVRVSIAAAIYILVYVAMYVVFVEPIYYYFGLGLRDDLQGLESLALLILAWAPSLLLPGRLTKPSDFLVALQYLLIYVPAVWVAMNASLPVLERGTAWLLILVLTAAMLIQLAANRLLPVHSLRIERVGRQTFWWALLGCTGAALAYLAFRLGGNFQLVSLDRIYELRTESADALQDAGSILGAYVFNWTSGALLPMLLALAIVRRSWILGLLGTTAYLFLFGVWGSKATLLAPIAIAAFAWLFRDPRRLVPIQLIGTFCVLLLLPVVFVVTDDEFRDFAVGWIVSVLHQRTFSSSALLIPQYLSFFEAHPYTLGSHIGPVRAFVEYPFDKGVPTMVGLHIYGSPMTANVNYWAQDGISAFGLWGVLPIAALAACVFWLLDSAARGLDPRFTTLCVAFAAMNLSDTSLFTTLLTGGLGIIIFALALMPRRLAQDPSLAAARP